MQIRIFSVIVVLVLLGCANLFKRAVAPEPLVPNSAPSPFAQRLEPCERPNSEWHDWQILWQNVDLQEFRFKDLDTLYSFFDSYLCRRTVVTEADVGSWDIPVMDSVKKVALKLGIEEEYLNQKVDYTSLAVYKIKANSDMLLVHLQARAKYVEVLFRKDQTGWYQLLTTIASSHVRVWYPDFWLLTGKRDHYLAIPGWQEGTGSGWHEENLRVYRIMDGEPLLVVNEPVYQSVFARDTYLLTSTIFWYPQSDAMAIEIESIRRPGHAEESDRTVKQVRYSLAGKARRQERVLVEEQVNIPKSKFGYSDDKLTHRQISVVPN